MPATPAWVWHPRERASAYRFHCAAAGSSPHPSRPRRVDQSRQTKSRPAAFPVPPRPCLQLPLRYCARGNEPPHIGFTGIPAGILPAPRPTPQSRPKPPVQKRPAAFPVTPISYGRLPLIASAGRQRQAFLPGGLRGGPHRKPNSQPTSSRSRACSTEQKRNCPIASAFPLPNSFSPLAITFPNGLPPILSFPTAVSPPPYSVPTVFAQECVLRPVQVSRSQGGRSGLETEGDCRKGNRPASLQSRHRS